MTGTGPLTTLRSYAQKATDHPSLAPASVVGTASAPPILDRPNRILVLDSDAERQEWLAAAMHQEGYETLRLRTDNPKLVEQASEFQPDAALLAIVPSGTDGYELCGELRSSESLRHCPIVLVGASEATEEQVARGLLAGADDFIPMGRAIELRARVAVRLRNKRYRDALLKVRSERDVLLREATVDPLTGLMNRRALEEAVLNRLSTSATFGLLFLDIDHFKRINDRYGHDVGDSVLRGIADYMKRSIRTGDACGRFGGEEFVILVDCSEPDLATRVADRHRIAISRIRYPKMGPTAVVTVSIGIGVYDPTRPDLDSQALYRRADSALYEAKRLGRNQVVLAPPPRTPGDPRTGEDGLISPTISLRPGPAVPSLTPPEVLSRPIVTLTSDPAEAELIRKLDGGRAALPVLPTAAAEALKLASDPDADVVRLAVLLDRDPHFAARFLSLANSAIYSRGIRTTTMRDAIVRIGLAASRDLLFQIVYAASTFGVPRYQDAVSRSFHKSVLAGVAARAISLACGQKYSYAYLCGLLHDVGEARVYRILASLQIPPRDPNLVEELVARYHCRAGTELAVAWRLPSDIAEVCSDHHVRPAPDSLHIRLAIGADLAVEAVVRGTKPPPPELCQQIFDFTGMPQSEIDRVLDSVMQAAKALDG